MARNFTENCFPPVILLSGTDDAGGAGAGRGGLGEHLPPDWTHLTPSANQEKSTNNTATSAAYGGLAISGREQHVIVTTILGRFPGYMPYILPSGWSICYPPPFTGTRNNHCLEGDLKSFCEMIFLHVPNQPQTPWKKVHETMEMKKNHYQLKSKVQWEVYRDCYHKHQPTTCRLYI